MARRLLMWSSMLKPSATKTAFVIAALATPALAGGKAPQNLKPAAAAASKSKLVAPVKVAAASADDVEIEMPAVDAKPEPSGADAIFAAVVAAPSPAPAAPVVSTPAVAAPAVAAPAPAAFVVKQVGAKSSAVPAAGDRASAVPSVGDEDVEVATSAASDANDETATAGASDEDERALVDAPVQKHGLANGVKQAPAKTAAAKGEYALGDQAFGTDYDILKPGRRSAKPGEAELVIVPRGLTQIQVGEVVKANHDELDYCWQRLAVIDRMPSTAVLKLKIDAKGAVTSLAIGGDAPATVNACLKEAVPHWTFPEAETKSELSYPVAFRSL